MLLGATLGLAWGVQLRGLMTVFAGRESSFTWSGTFAAILLPAALVGAVLGWAEHARHTGGWIGRRWAALAPLLFVVIPALVLDDFMLGLMTTGLGGGAVAIPLIGMIGGYALSGRGPRWACIVSRTFMIALVVVVIGGAFLVPFEQRLAPTEPAGAYALLTLVLCCGLLAGACAIPHLPAHHVAASGSRLNWLISHKDNVVRR